MILVFLTGCGIYNLNYFVMPDDSEFLALVQELDTPRKICQYMTDNFIYEQHILNILNPYQLYIKRKGDCDDFANFAQFIANYHNYKTYLVEICYSNYPYKHYIVIYEENGFYNFSDNQIYILVNYDNIPDIVKLDIQWHYNFYGHIWSSYTVYDYDNNIIENITSP
ncbi:hypothetical protein ES708_33436 [subsurface metagenome]